MKFGKGERWLTLMILSYLATICGIAATIQLGLWCIISFPIGIASMIICTRKAFENA
jgi:hypothetical protein